MLRNQWGNCNLIEKVLGWFTFTSLCNRTRICRNINCCYILKCLACWYVSHYVYSDLNFLMKSLDHWAKLNHTLFQSLFTRITLIIAVFVALRLYVWVCVNLILNWFLCKIYLPFGRQFCYFQFSETFKSLMFCLHYWSFGH